MSAPEPPGLLFKHKDTGLIAVLATSYAALLAAMAWLLDGPALILAALTMLVAVLTGLLLHLRRSRQAEDAQHLHRVQALLWLYDVLSFRAPLPPLSGWAAGPELLCTLVDLIRRRKPRQIVELGSGASTVVMSYALEQVGRGQVLALDHLSEYADQSARRLAEHGHQERAAVRHAPLRTQQFDGQSWQWYDIRSLSDEVETIDLLVIDGPPRETQPMARFPALPALFDRLSADAVIVLDDANRASEQKTLQKWKEVYPSLVVEERPGPKGTAVIVRERAETEKMPQV